MASKPKCGTGSLSSDCAETWASITPRTQSSMLENHVRILADESDGSQGSTLTAVNSTEDYSGHARCTYEFGGAVPSHFALAWLFGTSVRCMYPCLTHLTTVSIEGRHSGNKQKGLTGDFTLPEHLPRDETGE